MSGHYKPSAYNHLVRHGDSWLVFNGISSALIALNEASYAQLSPLLFASEPCPTEEAPSVKSQTGSRFRPTLNLAPTATFSLDANSNIQKTLEELIAGHFIVETNHNELEELETRFVSNKSDDPLLVTLVTTMDCNLDCYYCYEEKYPSGMSTSVCDQVLSYIKDDVVRRNQDRMHLGWFGGEPMLNRAAIEYLTSQLLPFCDEQGVRCTISMVSNGTLWPTDPQECRDFVETNRIGSIQFSFDGLPDHHNNRRHYKGGNRHHEVSSFEALRRTVDALRGRVRQYLRINLDDGNKDDAFTLVEMFNQWGWFEPDSKIYPYLAALGPYTDTCHSVERNAVAHSEFNDMDNEFRQFMSRYIDIREFAFANYPRALPLNCSAVAEHSVIFGPDGELYKCTHDLGRKHLSHGQLGNSTTTLFPILQEKVAHTGSPTSPHDYAAYNPFKHENCSKCRYLPTCLGGCPKVQFEKNEYYLESTCRYWEQSFEPMVRNYAKVISQTSLM